jgi:hypothetical protein
MNAETPFKQFPKIARLSRPCVITEKIDGTNASVLITDDGQFLTGSRTRWITPEDDNFGFSRWAHEHKDELLLLGPGQHFGEWWGAGIQRTYGLTEKRWSLFNTSRWADDVVRPACCHIVPLLAMGDFSALNWTDVMLQLEADGSHAAPGFRRPEGIIIYHIAANKLFKKTFIGDEGGKAADTHPKKEKEQRPPKDPSKGGRRIGALPFEGPDKRKST